MNSRRAERARELAERYPYAAGALDFYARVAEFDGSEAALRDLVVAHGPALLRDAAERGEEPALTFYSRVFRRLRPCGHQCVPQLGVLRPEGDGTRLLLVCAICRAESEFPRAHCPACLEKSLAWYQSDLFPHIQTQLCEQCRRYLHLVSLGRDPRAVPDVDEVAALPLDVWAIEQGYSKIHPNLIGV